jgi:hypothetical protein
VSRKKEIHEALQTMTVEQGVAVINARLQAMVAGEAEPYAAGWDVWATAFGLVPESPELMGPLWLIWGGLTDRVEVRPEETAQANEAMLRAAREWLALDDECVRTAYFDRWAHDELGY